MSWDDRALAWGTDKSSAGHGYMQHYEQLLRTRPVDRLLEIGVASGRSLLMWRELMPHASLIVGVDIVPECAIHQRADVRVVITNATDAPMMHAVSVLYGPFAVVIDDGSHDPADVLSTFQVLYPLVCHGGVYIIEDLHPQSEFVQGAGRWNASVLPAKDEASCLVVVERP